MTRLAPAALVAATLATGCAGGVAAQGQGLRDRVARAPDGLVHVTYAARAGVCGDGQSFLRSGTSTVHYGTGSSWSGDGGPACLDGPVRVEVTRSGGGIVALRTFAGPVPSALNGTDLGRVGAAEASAWLLGLAGTLEGRPAREAIMPALLADSTQAWPRLLTLLGDGARPYEVRSSAASWLAREAEHLSDADASRIIAALTSLVRDGREPQRLRSQALSVLGRMPAARGVEALLTLRRSDDPWIARHAMDALAKSGDPRARGVLRETARNRSATDAVRVSAIKGLARNWATAEDAALLRELFAGETSSDAREAILSALATLGGAENVAWLLRTARSAEHPEDRRRAISAAQRSGAGSEALAGLYESAEDRRTKESVVSALVRQGDRVAIDKLMVVARTETDAAVRKSVLNRLGRMDDPRVREMLRDLVER